MIQQFSFTSNKYNSKNITECSVIECTSLSTNFNVELLELMYNFSLIINNIENVKYFIILYSLN